MKRALAATIGGVLVAAGIGIPGVGQAATAPSEVRVVPAPSIPATYVTDLPIFAGATGFLHRRTMTSSYLWTTYADRRTTVIDALAGVNSGAIVTAGGDTIMISVSTPDHPVTDTNRQSLNLATNTWRVVPSGPATIYNRLLGDSVLVIPQTAPGTAELRRLAADGTYTTVPVTGVPEGTTTVLIAANDATAAVLRFTLPSGTRYGLLDVASGEVALLPVVPVAGKVVLSADRIGLLSTNEGRSFGRAEVRDGTATDPVLVTLPSTVPVAYQALAGDDVITAQPGTGTEKFPLVRHAPGGAEPTAVVVRADSALLQAPDGVLFTGGSGTGDWSVRKATATGQSVVVPLTGPTVNAGVALSTGVLRHIAAQARPGGADYRIFAEQIGPGAAGTGSTVENVDLISPVPCETGVICVRMADGSVNGPSYLSRTSASLLVMRPANATFITSYEVAPTAKLVDASANYTLLTNASSQDVIRNGGVKIGFEGVPGAALWFGTLWRSGPTGVLQPWNLSTGLEIPQPVSTGSACPATEVQATGKHLYWTCGATGPSGVYDLVRKTNIAVPAGQYLLGDNFLARHEANGTLVRLDLTDGTLGEPVTMSTFPRGDLADDRNITWAVDKFGGDVAWIDSANAAHIVDPGVTPSDPVAVTSSGPTELTLPGTVNFNVRLSRPVSTSLLTITQVRTGTAVARLNGGPIRVDKTITWDGLVDGRPVAKGAYRWSLAGVVDGKTTDVATGTFAVGCGGAPNLHSYECTGQPTLLGLTSASTGQGAWKYTRQGTAGATTLAAGPAESLGALNGLVPFGDISKDFKNDLLVRRSDGSMRVVLGGDTPPFAGRTVLLIPGNWNVYDALVHTGDVNGDAQADLIARDRESGALYLYTGTGTGGFNSPVKLAGGYKGYSRFVGAGDINGDGKPDLMMQYDPTSTMYVMYGNGNGTFQTGLSIVGTGWLGYNAVIGAGDLNEDGKNDLLLRDTAGNLYRRLGNGNGTFGDRALLGTGYQQYSGIY